MTNEERKQICDEMPYLIPHNVFGGEIIDLDQYDYSYIEGEGNIPKGWMKLFLQYCRDIRPILKKENQLDKFYFMQVKEKYGELRLYTCPCSEEINNITTKYEYISGFVCSECGKPAIYQTEGYILPYCEHCWKDLVRHKKGHFIEFNPDLVMERYTKNGTIKDHYDCFDIWERLYCSLRS